MASRATTLDAAWARPTPPPLAVAARPAAGYGLAFALFVILNATLFVRPAEVFPAVEGWPIYQLLILACIACAFAPAIRHLNLRLLKERPISVCVLGLLPAIVLSQLSHVELEKAIDGGFEFFKIVVYYLLLVGLLSTSRRLRIFLLYFTLFCLCMVLLALMNWHQWISLPSLAALKDGGPDDYVLRLRSTGIFHDPNDLSLILVFTIFLAAYWVGESRFRTLRWLWIGPVLMLLYALMLTHSRGGFLALLLGGGVFMLARFGLTKTILLGAVSLPVLFLAFGGRQTSLSTQEETGRMRIQLWSDGLNLLRGSPIFGIGFNEYAEQAGMVAHNSFVHAYTELGIVGGALFLGAFFFSILALARLGLKRSVILDPDMRRLHPYLLGAVVAYVGGMLPVSNCYVVPTYTVLGLVSAYLAITPTAPPVAQASVGARFVPILLGLSAIFLVGIYVFVRIFVSW